MTGFILRLLCGSCLLPHRLVIDITRDGVKTYCGRCGDDLIPGRNITYSRYFASVNKIKITLDKK